MLYPHAVVNNATAPTLTRCFTFIPDLLLRADGKLEATYGSHVRVSIQRHEDLSVRRNAHTCSREYSAASRLAHQSGTNALAHALRLHAVVERSIHHALRKENHVRPG